jgi:hypothetical protein
VLRRALETVWSRRSSADRRPSTTAGPQRPRGSTEQFRANVSVRGGSRTQSYFGRSSPRRPLEGGRPPSPARACLRALLAVANIAFACELLHSPSTSFVPCPMRPQSAKRRKDMQHTGATMTAAMRYAGLVSLLALSAATSSFAQSRAIHGDDPFRYCLPTTVDSSDEQKVYCEGWRAFRKGW